MSFTVEQVFASQGAQLTDEELRQLADLVKYQIRQRSSLNQGDLVLDKGQAVYQKSEYDYRARKRTTSTVTNAEAIEIFKGKRQRGGFGGSLYVRKSGGRQDKFIRMAVKRLRHAIEPLELMQKMFSTAVIDLPIAKEVIEAIENETAKVRAIFEEKAKNLPKLIEKQKGKVKKLKVGP